MRPIALCSCLLKPVTDVCDAFGLNSDMRPSRDFVRTYLSSNICKQYVSQGEATGLSLDRIMSYLLSADLRHRPTQHDVLNVSGSQVINQIVAKRPGVLWLRNQR